MKEISEMSYQELLDLETQIGEAKSEFYASWDLEIIEGHLCKVTATGNYNFWGTRTPVEYRDVFTGEYIGTYTILTKFPTFSKVLDENGIPYQSYMRLKELEDAWSQYRKSVQSL